LAKAYFSGPKQPFFSPLSIEFSLESIRHELASLEKKQAHYLIEEIEGDNVIAKFVVRAERNL
jgi:hypothetical protein